MTEYVATIGMFDGVHRGHQFVIRQVIRTAHERGMESMVITFDHSLRRDALLTSLTEKLALIREAGIDRIEVLEFTDELKQQTARQFMETTLRDKLNVKILMTGYDNRFGYHRAEGFDDYVRYGQQLGISVLQLPPEGQVSSTLIRQCLTSGKVADAAQYLGYPYTIEGQVAHGQHIGTRLGFPTANLIPSEQKQLIPAIGSYAVTIKIAGEDKVRNGMMNIGYRPTFNGQETTMEVHIFQLHADLYGKKIQVSLIERLRDELRFDNEESLRQQLQQDAAHAEHLLNKNILR